MREERRMLAIGLRMVAVLNLAIMFALVKLANQRGVHVVETVFYRQLFAVPLVLAWVAVGPGFRSLGTKRPWAHGVRTVIGLSGMLLNFWAFTLLPLAEATILGFTVPMITTLLSVLVLRETVGIHRWSAVVLGFVGVLIVVQPGHISMPLAGVAVGLAASMAISGVNITLRQIGRTEAATTTVFWFTMVSLVPLSAAMIVFGQMHDPATWGVLALLGITGGISQLTLTASLRLAPVSIVLPFDYSMLVWTAGLGWLIFGAVPDAATWLGAPLIIGSGLYIAYREHRLHRQRTAMIAPGE
jgi:drug/metabolite transporter (DMT)-like permease